MYTIKEVTACQSAVIVKTDQGAFMLYLSGVTDQLLKAAKEIALFLMKLGSFTWDEKKKAIVSKDVSYDAAYFKVDSMTATMATA